VGNRPGPRRIVWTATSLLLALLAAQAGCTRARYFRQANQEAYALIAEKSNDPRWALPGYTVEPDPRSRYFDPCDPIFPPMPPDDPASHQFMHCVDGMKGSRRWDAYGCRSELENPAWRECLGEYVDLTDEGAVKLSLESAVRMAYVNSPNYQEQLETLYLSALDVSTERFRYDVRFFGGNDTTYTHLGYLPNAYKGERAATKRESNRLRTDTDFALRRKFATAGELLVGFANSFVWQFAGPDSNTMAASLLNFSLVQPLLRAGGRAVALEQLTIAERTLLGNLRAFQRYRQGFFTQIAIGESGVAGPQRRGGFFGGTGLTGFTGTGAGGFGGVGGVTGFGRAGFGGGGGIGGGGGGGTGFAGGGAGQVGGFVGLLQQLQQIHNTNESLNAQIRSLRLLEAHLEAGTIDLTQVDQFRQSIETEQANLLQSRNALENSLDSFKRGTLGLPPDLPIELDDSLIRQFQFIDPEVSSLQYEFSDFLEEFGDLPAEPEIGTLRQALDRVETLRGKEESQFGMVSSDLDDLEAYTEARRQAVTLEEATETIDDAELKATFTELKQRFDQTDGRLQALRDQLTPDTRRNTADQVVELVTELSSIIDELSLVQARARMETVSVQRVELSPSEALDIARANRLDWMNNRAALVDTWRLIAFNANALRSNLDVVFEGDMGTVGKNPIEFRAPTGKLEAGVRFDAPFTRLLERNNFRQVLIDYQRDRRRLIQFEDSVHQSLRQLLRLLEQHAVNLEIQRRAVTIAIRRVDETREVLNEPPPPAQPGQPAAQLGPTAALNLMTALSDLRSSQNNFMSVWLNHYATRMQLERELGIMEIDDQGMWVERPLLGAARATAEEVPLPPPVPETLWLETPESDPPSPPPDEPPELPIPMTAHPQSEGDLTSPPVRKLARAEFSLM